MNIMHFRLSHYKTEHTDFDSLKAERSFFFPTKPDRHNLVSTKMERRSKSPTKDPAKSSSSSHFVWTAASLSLWRTTFVTARYCRHYTIIKNLLSAVAFLLFTSWGHPNSHFTPVISIHGMFISNPTSSFSSYTIPH